MSAATNSAVWPTSRSAAPIQRFTAFAPSIAARALLHARESLVYRGASSRAAGTAPSTSRDPMQKLGVGSTPPRCARS